MSTIRKELNPTGDISRNLEETLRKNGMEAHLREVGDSYQLLVMSHDSPQITYDISREDALKMMNGGSHASDKKAYNTFVSLVKNDFYVPNNYVHAKNVGSHVNMGLNGYRAEYPTGIPSMATPRFRSATSTPRVTQVFLRATTVMTTTISPSFIVASSTTPLSVPTRCR